MGLLGFGRMPGGVAAILELRSLRIRWAAGRGKTFRAVEIGVMSLFLLPSCRSRDEYTETVCFAGKKRGDSRQPGGTLRQESPPQGSLRF